MLVCISDVVSGQGWRAEIHVEVGDEIVIVENAHVSLGNFMDFAWGSSTIDFEVNGQGPLPTGALSIYVNGQSSDGFGELTSLYAEYDLTFLVPCVDRAFDIVTENGRIKGSLILYPQMEIAMGTADCGNVSLSTNTCSSTRYLWTWEVSEQVTGPFRRIPQTSSSLLITSQDLITLGIRGYGRKFFRVTGAPGTTSSLSVIDVPYPAPTATFAVTPPTCHGGTDGTIAVNIASAFPEGIDDFVVTVSGSQLVRQEVLNNTNTVLLSALPAGAYSVVIENNSNVSEYGSCRREYQVGPLTDPKQITLEKSRVSVYNGFNITCNGANDGFLAISASGGTGVYQRYVWTPDVSTSNSATNLPAGTYTVRVTDSNNCQSDATPYTLSEPEALRLEMTSTGGRGGYEVSCADKSDGALTTSVAGGVAAYSYVWSSGASDKTISDLGAGTYHLAVTDANGCVAEGSYTLNAPPPITFALAEVSQILCAGDETGALEVQSPVNTIGAIYYRWSSGETGKDITGKAAGAYTVTVSDDQGCHAARSHTLDEPPAWSVDVAATSDYNGMAIRCHGDSNGVLSAIVRDGGGNVTTAGYYDWYKDGAPLVSGARMSSAGGLNAGAYTLRITYNSFCRAEKSVLLKEPEALVAHISVDTDYNGFPISCYNAADGAISVTASGGTGGDHTYTWQDGSTGTALRNLAAGRYVVVARDANGCEATAERTLEQPDTLTPVIAIRSSYNGQAISCAGAADARLSVSTTGGAAGFRYVWNTGQNTRELIDVAAGTYTVTATDVNGCQANATKTVADPGPVKATIINASSYNGFGVSCAGARDGSLLADAVGGTGTYAYRWIHNDFRQARISDLPAGAYEVRVSDMNGCTTHVAAVITEPPAVALTVSRTRDVACNGGADGAIEVDAAGGTGTFWYSSGTEWQTTPRIENLKAATYTLTVKDENACQQSKQVTLSEPPALALHLEQVAPAFCGDPRGSISASVTGGSGGYAYHWKDYNGTTISALPEISGLSAGLYTLTVTDDHACQAIQSVGITSTDGPTVSVGAITDATCFDKADGSAEIKVIDGAGPFTYRWEDGQTESTAVHLRKGNHLVAVTDVNQCTTVETVSIAAPDPLEVILVDKREPACHADCNGLLRVAAQGGNSNYTYNWQSASGATLNKLCEGAYDVVVSDEKGCTTRKTFALGAPPALAVKLVAAQSPDCYNGCDGRLELSATGGAGGARYAWSNGMAGPAISNLCAGTYSAIITDENNCSIHASYSLENPAKDLLDLGSTVTLCAGQTHTLDPGPNWKRFTWNASTGFESHQQRVSVSEAGMYWLEAETFNGCIARDTFALQTSTDLLNANFLLSSEAMAGDTVVMIDVSWPIPEHISWRLPTGMDRLGDPGEIVYGTFATPGSYHVALTATLGECRDEVLKSIAILPAEEISNSAGRRDDAPFVKAFSAYPNPNDGSFDVSVSFREESALVLTIWNTLSMKRMIQIKDDGKPDYVKHIDLKPLSSGTYTLRLDCDGGTKFLRFIVR